MKMFCFQCQEAAKGVGCQAGAGVCGKTAETANLQDLLIYVLKGISYYQLFAHEKKMADDSIDSFVVDGLFKTITNANFDDLVFLKEIKKGLEFKKQLQIKIKGSGIEVKNPPPHALWTSEQEDMIKMKSKEIGVLDTENEDLRSLQELCIYGLKGIAAYLSHANNLDQYDIEINKFIEKALVATTDTSLGADELTALVLETGEYGVKAMALLDKANTGKFGNPEITEVNIGVGKNPAILITGHDLADMKELLEQTKDQGIDIYTHSEMLPANYYPEFKKYSHFHGNYGSSWWNQKEEFKSFNGPILFTTNCIVPPLDDYKSRMFTTGNSGFFGCTHILPDENGKKDFTVIIDMAKTCESPQEIETGKIVGGFAHNQVFALADKVVDAVKTGAIKKFVVMAGCDGRMKNRSYYTEFAEKLPKDVVILTAGCAKYRYNKLNLGDIGGIPRILDAGQCNDSYSLAVIALKLKEVFELDDINDLPIVYNIAWYEQKAVIVLLALLYLGIKNIHLGPTLPAFLSPNITNVLVENFGIGGISDPDSDIVSMIM
jgi:hydroxylamine reductase